MARKPTTVIALRFPSELVTELRAAAHDELGARPQSSGDAAIRIVIQRLVEDYIRRRAQEKPIDDAHAYPPWPDEDVA